MAFAAYQYELIQDDPRLEESGGVMADLREFYRLSREMGGLLTLGQASKILGVSSNQVSVWVSRGRIASQEFLGVKMVSGGEVLALHKERLEKGIRTGGRGKKAPSLLDLARAAAEDFQNSKE